MAAQRRPGSRPGTRGPDRLLRPSERGPKPRAHWGHEAAIRHTENHDLAQEDHAAPVEPTVGLGHDGQPGGLLTAREVAALLGVPTSWVYERSRNGTIPTVTLGRYRRYRRSAIDAWIRELEGAEGAPRPDRRTGGARSGTGATRSAALATDTRSCPRLERSSSPVAPHGWSTA